MYNRLKSAQKLKAAQTSYDMMLQDQTKADDLSVDGITNQETQLDGVRDNKELIDITEVQMAGDGREKVSETLTEDQLNKGKTDLTTLRDDRWSGSTLMPMSLLNQAQEQEHLKAFRAADTEPDDTEFWDKYVSAELLGEPLKSAPSQLHNHPDRYKKIKNDPSEVSSEKAKKMVTASLKDADAMLFDIYVKAAGRELTGEENILVDRISADKARILMACDSCVGTGGMGGGDSEIMQLHKFVSDPNTPHDERWEEAQAKLAELLAGNSDQLDRSPVHR